MKIGVLALQGAFAEHIRKLRGLDVAAVEVRLPAELDGISGLIIPGGESRVIGKLAQDFELMQRIRQLAETGAVWGTCAGMILMAKDVGIPQPLLGVMDITVTRNAFGRQVDSFETALPVDQIQGGRNAPFPAVFIRAPKITAVGRSVSVLAALPDGTPVAARQGRLLVTAFHPELTADDRFHGFFLNLANGKMV
jgi:5'-phosphate synthase pdxT subunit